MLLREKLIKNSISSCFLVNKLISFISEALNSNNSLHLCFGSYINRPSGMYAVKTYKAGENPFPASKLSNKWEPLHINGIPVNFLITEILFFLSSSSSYMLSFWYYWSFLLLQLTFLATEEKCTLHNSKYFCGYFPDSTLKWTVATQTTAQSTATTANHHSSSIYTSKCHLTRHWMCIKLSLLPYFQGKGVFAIRHSEIQQVFQLFKFFFLQIQYKIKQKGPSLLSYIIKKLSA